MTPPTPSDLAAVLRYAQTIMPLVPPPAVARLHTKFTVALHNVTRGDLVGFLAVNDDLAWNVQTWDCRANDVYWSATLALKHCELTFFSEHHPAGTPLVGPTMAGVA